jgi:hypothetical protein
MDELDTDISTDDGVNIQHHSDVEVATTVPLPVVPEVAEQKPLYTEEILKLRKDISSLTDQYTALNDRMVTLHNLQTFEPSDDAVLELQKDLLKVFELLQKLNRDTTEIKAIVNGVYDDVETQKSKSNNEMFVHQTVDTKLGILEREFDIKLDNLKRDLNNEIQTVGKGFKKVNDSLNKNVVPFAGPLI